MIKFYHAAPSRTVSKRIISSGVLEYPIMQPISGYPQIQAELEMAENARARGNEGMARVCARRAAGMAAGEYISQRGLPFLATSAYDRLKFLSGSDAVPRDIRHVAAHFLLRVTPDHSLPVETDLIADARWLIDRLLEPS
ncbi:MAG: hypothetical protein ACWGO1_01715 [Anaerolineales bacterium]